jgi:hypothetical protein
MFVYSQTEIDDIKKNVADLWRESSRNTLQMGMYLESLRLGMSASDFSAYLQNELSRMGISRSTAYRWIVLAQEIRTLFPNRHVYEALVPLTSGRGIFAACTDSNAHLQEDWVPLEGMIQPLPAHLTPTAQEALSMLPAPPEEHLGESQAEAWAASFVKAMKEARARRSAEARAARKTEAGQAKQRQAFLDKLHNLAAGCSPEALREFREQLNQVLDKDRDEHDAISEAKPVEAGPVKEEALQNGAVASAGPVSQSQNRNGNLSPAAQAKESGSGSTPNTVNHQNKDRMQNGASSAAASPNAVPTAQPSQSQNRTGKRRRRRNRRRRKPAWLRESMNRPDQDSVQGGASSAPTSQRAVPEAQHSQSQNRTGSPSQPKEAATVFKSQPEDPKSRKSIYPDEPRRSVYAQDFVFRVP